MTNPTPIRRVPASTIVLAVLLVLAAGTAVALALGWFKPGNEPAGAQAPPAAMSAAAVDASAVLKRLTDAGLPMTSVVVQDENTDPNHLLGRPNGYTARVSFDVPGGDPDADKYTLSRGGVIEIFPSEDAARRRSTYLQELAKNEPILGTEYNYIRGPVLLRLIGDVKPSLAAQFEAAFQK